MELTDKWIVYLLVLLTCQCYKVFGQTQQSFRERPQNTDVVLGHQVILRCRVDHQKGQVQWTRGGFAFGFDRSLTGHPRYTMVGDASQGVHDLRITNTSMVDDNKFECQVTPMAPSIGIRHKIDVTVLVPPSSIEMIGQPANSKKTVKAGERHTFECLAQRAKPAPSIHWFRGSEQLVLDDQVNTEEDSDDPKLKSMRSKITITPSSLDNGVSYSCRTSHPALDLDAELSASVILDVQYSPGPPEITGYEEGDTLTAGDNKTLTCKSRGGNPLPEVIWYKNGLQIDTQFNKHHSYTVNAYHFMVDSSDNGAIYECHVHNLMTSHPKKAQVNVKVNFPPSVVKITNPEEVRVGDVIAISCEAVNSNPASDVSLVINRQTTPGIQTQVTPTDQGGFTTFANLPQFLISETDSDLDVNCFATNSAIGKTMVQRAVIKVLRPPHPPFIFGYNRGTILKQGQAVTLTCRSEGGNPLPDLKWYKGYQLLSEETVKRESQGASEAQLSLLVDNTDNGAEYRCEASNSATSFPLVNSTIMTVIYPPSSVNVSVFPSEPLEGDSVLLTCTSAPAFRRANLTWWKGGYQVLGEYGPDKNGTYLGVITTYSVTINVTRDDNDKIYTCQGRNEVGPSTHAAVTLNIRYAPVIKEITGESSVSEGGTISLWGVAEGNPSPVDFLWKRGNDVIASGKVFNKTNANMNDAGIYTLEATNDIGTTSKNITVVIKFAPVIKEVKGSLDINNASEANLECHFTGSPDPKVSWSRDGFNMDKTQTSTSSSAGRSILTVRDVRPSDTGFFTCTAENDLGKASSSEIALVVNQKPEIDKSPKYQKAAAELGGKASLVCRIRSSPKPTFTWFTRTHEPISTDIHPRYTVMTEKLVDKLNMYESVLEVHDVTTKDHGFFKCQAMNSLGIITSLIQLEGTSRPDPPVDLKVVNATHDAIKLTWIPGFDGGMTQTFRIRYQRKNSHRIQYVDVFPSNSTEFWVTGLDLGTTYEFKVSGLNSKGKGDYSEAKVEGYTLSDPPASEKAPPGIPSRISGLVIVIITLVGAAFLVLNVALITCFIRRSAKKRLTASSDKGSSKGTTMEMYAPSSYTGTVTGETLSSISEKSRESYAQEHDSADDYEEGNRIPATSSYLIEKLDPPPQYASRPPPHILPPPVSHNDLGVDESQDRATILRNQFNTSLDHVPGYGTLGRRGHTPAAPPSLGNGDPYSLGSTRYNTYMPPSAHHHPQSPLNGGQVRAHPHPHQHPHIHYEGSLKRNPPKLHFPKDYIRNGATNNGGAMPHDPIYSRGTPAPPNSVKMGSPTSANPPPVLSSFAPDLTGGTGVPMDQRGHLV